MKKILKQFFVIIIVLSIFTGGGLLINQGIKTFKNDTVAKDDTESKKENGEEKKDLTLQELEQKLETAKQNINNKKEELETLNIEKRSECDRLKIKNTELFFKDNTSEEYIQSNRDYEKCLSEKNNIWEQIWDLEHESSSSNDDEIENLINAKQSIESEIEEFKNPNPITNYNFFRQNKKEINWNKVIGIIEIIGGILIILIEILSIIGIYNKIVKSLHRVENDFANIDVYLKKRWDLIPNIVESVKGYKVHESDTLKEVTELRNSNYNNMKLNDKVSINNKISDIVSKIMVLKEEYPDLKANDNFLDLSSKLTKIEDDIATSRIKYNNSVMHYNNVIKIFPNNLLVSFFKYNEMEMFKISSDEKDNVSINF